MSAGWSASVGKLVAGKAWGRKDSRHCVDNGLGLEEWHAARTCFPVVCFLVGLGRECTKSAPWLTIPVDVVILDLKRDRYLL